MTKAGICTEAIRVYENHGKVLETGRQEALQSDAHSSSEPIVPRGLETGAALGIVPLPVLRPHQKLFQTHRHAGSLPRRFRR